MRFEMNENNIRKDIEVAITRSMNAAAIASAPLKPQEPDFVAKLVDIIPQDLYKSLKTYAPKYKYLVSGVFCHQKPLADFGSKKPELGDLLLVYIEENKYGKKKCNALLLQAKMLKKAPYIVPSSEEHQLKLYEEWPSFVLCKAGIHNGDRIDVHPKTLNSGAQYLLMKEPCNNEKHVSCAYPDKELLPEKKLSKQIIDVMKFFSGRTFLHESEGKSPDDWTNMIWKLIDLSGISMYNRARIGINGSSRQNSYGDEILLNKLNLEDNDELSDMNEDKVSTILIYASESEEELGQQKLPLF